MFDGLLKIAPRCDVCGADFECADVGDGASVFVLFIVGFLAMVLFLLVEAAFSPPWWVHAIFQLPFVPLACIAALRHYDSPCLMSKLHHRRDFFCRSRAHNGSGLADIEASPLFKIGRHVVRIDRQGTLANDSADLCKKLSTHISRPPA